MYFRCFFNGNGMKPRIGKKNQLPEKGNRKELKILNSTGV
jgi:hypothetical protein